MADQAITVEIEREADKPRLKAGQTARLDVPDSELSQYGQKVKNRIDKLRLAFHEERRRAEQAQRDKDSASNLARRLYTENQELRKNVTTTERAFVNQAVARTDAELTQAGDRLTRAHEEGKGDEIAKATHDVARLAAERERLKMLEPPEAVEETARQEPSAQPGYQAGPSQEDLGRSKERLDRWKGKNKWFGSDAEMTTVAYGAHDRLTQQNISELTNPDLYWSTIDKTVKAVFPDKFNGDAEEAEEEEESEDSRPEVAASRRSSAVASSGHAKVVRLNESQVRLARVLGITNQQYAEEWVKKEGEA